MVPRQGMGTPPSVAPIEGNGVTPRYGLTTGFPRMAQRALAVRTDPAAAGGVLAADLRGRVSRGTPT